MARVQLLARGTSGNAAAYLKHLIERRLHVPAAIIAPSVLTQGAARPWNPRGLASSTSSLEAALEPATRNRGMGRVTRPR